MMEKIAPRNEEETRTQIKDARKKFIPMAMVYFLGVFNDNFYKQCALLLAVSLGKSGAQSIATVIFALPFILFATPAGWLADRVSKGKVVIASKILEFIAMIFGALGIYFDYWPAIYAMLGIMALQSTIFSPSLNGSIPELYPRSYVIKANAIIKLVSNSAILIGILCSGIALNQKYSDEKISTQIEINNLVAPQELVEKIVSKERPVDLFLWEHMTAEQQTKMKSIKHSNDSLKINLEIKKELCKNINAAILRSDFLNLYETQSSKSDKVDFNDHSILTEDEKLNRKELIASSYEKEIKTISISRLGIKIVAFSIIFIAFVGVFISFWVPRFPAASPNKAYPMGGPIKMILLSPLQTTKDVWGIRKDYLLSLTFFSFVYFYFLASLLVLLINSLGIDEFGFGLSKTSYLPGALLVGIAVGSLLAGIFGSGDKWFKIIAPGLALIGMSMALVFLSPYVDGRFPGGDVYYYIFVLLFLAGIGGGLFVIPLESFIQIRPAAEDKGTIIAASNFVSFIGISLSGISLSILEIYLKPSISFGLMGIITLLMTGVLIFFVKKIPQWELDRNLKIKKI